MFVGRRRCTTSGQTGCGKGSAIPVEGTSGWKPPHLCGGGALQRSGESSTSITRFSAGIEKVPGAKAHFNINYFSAGLKSSSPLLKQEAPTKSLPQSLSAAGQPFARPERRITLAAATNRE